MTSKLACFSISEVFARIMADVTCQADCDARVGDAVDACADAGIIAIPGKVIYDDTGPVPPCRVVDWTFISNTGA